MSNHKVKHGKKVNVITIILQMCKLQENHQTCDIGAMFVVLYN